MGKIPGGLTRGYKSYCMKNLRVQVSNIITYEEKEKGGEGAKRLM
jgi:hypothetical protein